MNNSPIEINIWLDSYDEMFSDFDPRPYRKRVISDDFISQVRKVVKDQYQRKMTLCLLLLEPNRNHQDEQVIAERIINYFKTNSDQLQEEKRTSIRKGLLLVVLGILLMLMASYFSFIKSESYYVHMLLILFEPAGWFLLWMGLEKSVNFPTIKRRELDFFAHMAKTEIKFGTYKQDLNQI